jgi:hypothetical protein
MGPTVSQYDPFEDSIQVQQISISLYHLYDKLFMITFSNLMSPDTVNKLYKFIQ